MPTAEIIVLANSQKHGGRCIAGLAAGSRDWVRPVSSYPHGELTPIHCSIDGKMPRLLDVVRFEHQGTAQDPGQPENVTIAPGVWQRVKRIAAADLYEEVNGALVGGPTLLGSYGHYIEELVAARGLEASLALIEPHDLVFSLDRHDRKPGGSPRAKFRLDGGYHDLPLTEFIVAPRLHRAGYGSHDWAALGLPTPARTLLVASLGTPYNGRCYKLAAAVLPLP